MPVESENILNIACDNPDCPGNDLDPTDRTGWFFIISEFYGEPTTQHVFCSNTCAGGAATNEKAEFGRKHPTRPETPTPRV